LLHFCLLKNDFLKGWWSGSSSKKACQASMKSWVQIPVPQKSVFLGWEYSSVLDLLPSMHEVMDSILKTTKIKNKQTKKPFSYFYFILEEYFFF
jgi:hypothetical protein